MSRYIKLEDLQKFPIRIDHYDKKNGNEHFVYGVESVLEYAEYLPTADVIEVVRCRDCKHYKAYEPPIEDFDGWCKVNENEYDKEFYCSYGERREECL